MKIRTKGRWRGAIKYRNFIPLCSRRRGLSNTPQTGRHWPRRCRWPLQPHRHWDFVLPPVSGDNQPVVEGPSTSSWVHGHLDPLHPNFKLLHRSLRKRIGAAGYHYVLHPRLTWDYFTSDVDNRYCLSYRPSGQNDTQSLVPTQRTERWDLLSQFIVLMSIFWTSLFQTLLRHHTGVYTVSIPLLPFREF